jgi:hypothetical protein
MKKYCLASFSIYYGALMVLGIHLFHFDIASAKTDEKANEKPNKLVHCLGQEELIQHQKYIRGPIYRLNQELIIEIAQTLNVSLKEKKLHEICHHKKLSPSLALVQALMFQGTEIFDTSLIKHPLELSHEKQNINYIKERSITLFVDYLSHLQVTTPYANCLNKSIPDLALLFRRFQNLQDVATKDYLLHDQNLVKNIFKSLENFDEIYSGCESETKLKKPQFD